MKNKKMVETINALLIFSCLCFGAAAVEEMSLLWSMCSENGKVIHTKYVTALGPTLTEEAKRQPGKAIVEELKLRNVWNSLDVKYDTYETEYIGRYFVTAYSHLETGSRATASGVPVHASDNNFEPTTCAIDRRYHSFGEYLMIDGKVYVTEDTGGMVKGLWVDCYVETMEEVHSWPTGYKSVYSVTYKTVYLPKNERKETHERLGNYLHDRSACGRVYLRNDLRTADGK